MTTTTFDPVLLTINDQPRDVLGVMDTLIGTRAQQSTRVSRRRWIPKALFFGAIPFILIDLLLGFSYFTFSLVAVGMWIAALIVRRSLRRAEMSTGYPPQFATAREVINTLRDDLQPKGRFFGQVDLTGPQQPAKLFKRAQNALGRDVEYYRDEWLSLKAKLYDGNMLRVSAVARHNVRVGFYGIGRISGKSKWKPPKSKIRQTITVRLAVNAQVYDIVSNNAIAAGSRIGPYVVDDIAFADGIVRISASTPQETVSAADLLEAMRAVYAPLRRKDLA